MKTRLLDKINSPADLKQLYKVSPDSMPLLEREIREQLIETVSKNGGHLAPNLGVVELTIATHLAFDFPNDSIIFDVGHQSYVHKILTGRRDQFPTLRKINGLSGFPKRSESVYDTFDTGHASTSVSAALGVARAKKLMGDDSYTVAFIGDGACTGGMVFEALNDAGQSELPLIIILNDNNMAIAKTVGAFGTYLGKLRASNNYRTLKKSTRKLLNKLPRIGKALALKVEHVRDRIKFFMLPNRFFESMGLTYIGAIDGHNVDDAYEALNNAKKLHAPVVVHFVTQKGKGYTPAEANPEKFHGIGAFDLNNPNGNSAKTTNSQVFGDCLTDLAKLDKRIIAISAAMPASTGLNPFLLEFPERFFDVGIAEQHAVTMSAGACAGGLRPVVALYSTFLQRAYDQILHDVCLQNLPVVFGVDRAGLVGDDGETHQGVYDIAFLSNMPGLYLFSPSTICELKEMLKLALSLDNPIAIRYNRGSLPDRPITTALELGKWESILPLGRVNILATGRMVDTAIRAANGLDVGIVNVRFISPMDENMLDELKKHSDAIITLEDGVVIGGFGSRIAQYMSEARIKVFCLGIPNHPIQHATVAQQDVLCGINAGAVRMQILEVLGAYR